MAVGWGNPKDNSNSTASRPAHVNTGAAARRWFQNGTIISPEDLNSVLAAIRHTADTYAVTDVEGDDTYLTDAIAAAVAASAPDAGFITSTNAALALRVRVDAAQSFSGGQLTQGRANLALGSLAVLSSVATANIADAAVTNAKQANMASATIKGRQTGTTGAPQDLTVAQLKTMLALTTADFVDLGTLATADEVTTGLIADGAVTMVKLANMAAATVIGRAAGAGTGVPSALTSTTLKTLLALTPADIPGLGDLAALDTVTNTQVSASAAIALTKLATIATARLLGNVSGITATPSALTAAQVKTMLGITSADVTGLDAALALKAPLASPAFTGSPTFSGALLAPLAFKTTIVNADVSASAAIAWSKINAAGAIVNADVSGTAAIALSKLQAIGDQRLIGNISGATDTPLSLTATQVKAMLDIAISDLSGIAPAALLGNNTGSAAAPLALSMAAVKTMLNLHASDVVDLGTAATKDTGTSGATVPLLNGADTFSGANTFSDDAVHTGRTVLGAATHTLTSNTAGAITIDSSMARVETFGGAATGQLATINGGWGNGHLLIVTAFDNAHTIEVVETDNIRLAGTTVSLDTTSDVLLLVMVSGVWMQVSFSNNT